MHIKRTHLTATKYAFSILATLLAYSTCKDVFIMLDGILELLVVFILSNHFLNDNKRRQIIVYVLSSVFFFLFNTQMLVMYFGGTYISMMMLTNISSLRDISANFAVYGIGILAVILFSFLPITKIEIPKLWEKRLLVIIPVLSLICVSAIGWPHNTIYSLFSLIGQSKDYNELQETVNSVDTMAGQYRDIAPEFYKEGIEDEISKPSGLQEKPNVILIFTEGLSKSVVEDERNITPNLQKFSKRSLSFENYYNHTFATYRGLIGQLYSGYQLNNSDTNNLIALQDIFSAKGYNTAFINTEPDNEEFTTYLTSFGFDYLITDEAKATAREKTLSDKSAYELLWETCTEMSALPQPFFTSIYTFGTHVSLDSPDEVFEDGKDAELNKFYNMDYQFGEFLEKFENSPLADNTLLIFTADHCTYVDQAFKKSFPDVERYHSDVGEIILYFYYKGITPDTIDVDGRNSINFAPTLLDYLDITAPNFFLGDSLFGKEKKDNLFATTFYDPFNAISTKNGEISVLDENAKKEFVKKVTLYLTASKNMKVDSIPLPTEEDAAVVDEGTYFEDTTLDSYQVPYYPNYYYNNYYYYNYTEQTPVPESVPAPVSEPVVVDPGTVDPPVDTGGTDTGGTDVVIPEPVVDPAPVTEPTGE